jgi:hypothetical protein
MDEFLRALTDAATRAEHRRMGPLHSTVFRCLQESADTQGLVRIDLALTEKLQTLGVSADVLSDALDSLEERELIKEVAADHYQLTAIPKQSSSSKS